MGKVTEKFAIISESRWDFLALPGLFGLIDPKNCYIWPYKTMVVSTFQKWHCRPTVFPRNHLTRFQTYGLISSKSMLIYHFKVGMVCTVSWSRLHMQVWLICHRTAYCSGSKQTMPPGDVVFYHVLQHSAVLQKRCTYTNPGDYWLGVCDTVSWILMIHISYITL